jgi:KTSC domain
MAAPKIAKVGRIRATQKPSSTIDEEEGVATHDLGPWVETPQSTRVSAFRYDFANDSLQVQWTNRGRPYVYFDISYEQYRGMVRAMSKGKYVPNLGSNYQPMEGDHAGAEDLPSNASRRAPTSRAR